MEENKSVQEELTEETALAPECGQEETQQPAAEETTQQTEEVTAEETAEGTAAEEVPEESPKAPKRKTAIAAICVVVVLAVLFVLVLVGAQKKEASGIPANGNPNDVTCKGTYTVTDKKATKAADTVVATIGDAQLTNAQLQTYYWGQLNSQYGYMLMVYGLFDYTQPLDTQIYSQTEEETLTWQHFFLDRALQSWQTDYVLAQAATEAGMELSQETADSLSTLPQSLEEQAISSELSNAQELITSVVGINVSLDDYINYCTLNAYANLYYTAKTEAMVPTQEELEAFFAENEESYAENGITKDSKYVDVRHILLSVEGGTTDESGTTTYSDEEWEACRVKAQEVLDTWLAGEQTEEAFAELANTHSQDPGSNTTGGLYEDVYEGQMVQAFNDWCFDETRTHGDYGMVQTNYGYHVMFFVGSTPIWEETAKSDWVTQQASNLLEELVAANPMTVNYKAIKLADLNLAG